MNTTKISIKTKSIKIKYYNNTVINNTETNPDARHGRIR